MNDFMCYKLVLKHCDCFSSFSVFYYNSETLYLFQWFCVLEINSRIFYLFHRFCVFKNNSEASYLFQIFCVHQSYGLVSKLSIPIIRGVRQYYYLTINSHNWLSTIAFSIKIDNMMVLNVRRGLINFYI